ncbi:MAG: hypothetical protein JWO69_1875 [Thermoleophilia bacterium]|jgi:hypothetical protein|nr:hypothetical protein [Thermoleophilia bacterium]
MSLSREQLRAQAAATTADLVHGSATGAPSSGPRAAAGKGAEMFGDVPAHVRMKMELVARASGSPEAALMPIIDILVEGSARKRAAIVGAILTNEPLREQWERTWHVLRR